MQDRRYPKIFIRSKSELAKHISHYRFSRQEALNLINDVLNNFDNYWKDSKMSEPEKEKYFRSAKGTPLGSLLQKIDAMVLAPHDKMLPNFIFGGVRGTNHAMAAKSLLGCKRKRVLLKLDIKRFFEQINQARVTQFFRAKCACSKRAAKLIGRLCCVSLGPKNSVGTKKTIARGFATSPRLAVWCNLDTFIKLDRLIKKRLRGRDPRIMIYVDDIGITAAQTTREEMENLYGEIYQLFMSDPNQILVLHPLGQKSKIIAHEEGMHILGLELRRNKLILGEKTKSKIDRIKKILKTNPKFQERKKLVKKRRALARYKNYIENL